MTWFDQIDLMARGGSIALLALWSILLLRDHRNELAAKLAVAMNAGICCYLVVTSGWYREPNVVGLLFALGASATPGLFWMFAKAWFNDEKQLSVTGLLLVTAMVANTLLLQLSFESDGVRYWVSRIVFRLAMLAFAAAAFWEMWRSREGDLIEGRRRLRPLLVGTVGAYVIAITFAEVAFQTGLTGRWLQRLIASGIVLVVLAFCAAMFRVQQADLFGTKLPEQKRQPVSRADDPLAEKLLQFMAEEKAHRDETMSIAKLAAMLGEQEYRLRRVINGQLGHRNFASFLNGFRLDEVKAALSDPTQRGVPIITIALDAGFGSLGPFNRAFREAEGMTPSEYRAANAG